MNKQIEEWIGRHSYQEAVSWYDHGIKEEESADVIRTDDLRALLKGHAIVPREPSYEMLRAAKVSGILDPRVSECCYKAMLKANEESK